MAATKVHANTLTLPGSGRQAMAMVRRLYVKAQPRSVRTDAARRRHRQMRRELGHDHVMVTIMSVARVGRRALDSGDASRGKSAINDCGYRPPLHTRHGARAGLFCVGRGAARAG